MLERYAIDSKERNNMRKVRIEEVCIGADKEFTKDKWIESDLQYADTLTLEETGNTLWIVVEV